MFADDSFMLFRANDIEKDILSLYEKASGQSINMTKSEIFYNANTNPQT